MKISCHKMCGYMHLSYYPDEVNRSILTFIVGINHYLQSIYNQ